MTRRVALYFPDVVCRFARYTQNLISLSLLLLLSCNVAAQSPTYAQYSESACLLIADQVKRFEQQPHLPSYQDALKNYRRHCQQPTAQQPKPYFDESVLGLNNPQLKNTELKNPATKTPVTPAVMAPPVAPINQAIQPLQAATEGLFKLLFWLLPMLLAIFAFRWLVKGIWGFNRIEILGRKAELQLAKLLKKQLSPEYVHYHNLILKTAQGDLTEIDHLIVSPYGVFVIEVKNYQGWIFGGEHQAQWVVQHYRRKHSFQNPLRQNFKHTEAVAHLLDISRKTESDNIHSVIAFHQRAQMKTAMPENVLYIEDVYRHIRKLSAFGKKFSDEALLRYTAKFNVIAADAKLLKKQHQQQQQGQALLRQINQNNGLE